jgi:rare lipoprotein A
MGMSRKKCTLRSTPVAPHRGRKIAKHKKTYMSRIVLGVHEAMIMPERPIHACAALLALALLSVAGCGHRTARVHAPVKPARIGKTETGVASWYGIPYDGRRAASGEIYDMRALTAAHRNLPFQTWVEVTNLSNGKRVDVRINDRGPFVRGRIIDLSQEAARDIDMLRTGTARVRLKVIPPPAQAPILAKPEAPPSTVRPNMKWYVVQAGAFSDENRAEALRVRLEDLFAEARSIPDSANLWHVFVGRQMTLDQANDLAARVRKETGEALVVAEPEPDSASDPDTRE